MLNCCTNLSLRSSLDDSFVPPDSSVHMQVASASGAATGAVALAAGAGVATSLAAGALSHVSHLVALVFHPCIRNFQNP